MSIMAKTPSGYKKIGSAYLGEQPVDKVFNANGDVVYALQRELTGVPPLLFKGKEQSELLNYRIYGDTVDGESVGDRTANLIQGSIKNANIGNNGKINTSNEFFLVYAPVVTGESYTISNNNGTNVYAFYNAVPSTETATSYDSNRQLFSTSTITFVSPITGYIAVRLANTAQDIMLNAGSTALPYEPYGYNVPVTVAGKNLFNNIWEQGNIRADNGQKEASNIMICSDYFPVEYDKTYSISRTISEGYNNVRGYDASKNYIGGGTTVCSVMNPFVNKDAKKGIFKITNSLVAFVRFNHYSDNLNMKYMIVEGDYTNTPMPPYEPYHAPVTIPIYLPEPIKMVGDEAEYVDYSEQKQHRVRKNLLQNTATSRTINGVTLTLNSDGSVTCNGTATALIVFKVNAILTLPVGEFVLTGCPTGGNSSYYLYVQTDNINPQKFYRDTGNGVTINNTSADIVYSARFVIEASSSLNDLTFYPMIRKADIEDDTYEPYIENTEVDVTLPALPTIKGTNTMSIDTTVQPSRIDIKGRIKTLT